MIDDGAPASPPPESLPASYFDAVYAADRDPWRYESSDYERAKYDATLAALAGRRWPRALEIGCSIGVLTARLATACDALLSVDVSEQALAAARARCAALPQVTLRRMRLPEEAPEGSFDAIVISEVGYYWSRADLARVAAWAIGRLRPGGVLLLVHWTHPVHDYPLSGDEVHDEVARRATSAGLRHARTARHADYRLDAWQAAAVASAGEPTSADVTPEAPPRPRRDGSGAA